MKNLIKISFFTLIFLAQVLFAQIKSTHQFEDEYYKEHLPKSWALNFQVEKQFSNLQLNKTVFGYLPWWQYLIGSHKNLRYDLLSHIAIFSFEADSLGNISNPAGWPWGDVIAKSKENKVKLILTVTNFDANSIHSLFSVEERRTKLFSNISQTIKTYGFEGINIDFENVKVNDRNSVISNFFSEMKKYFLQQNIAAEISFASPAASFGGWNFYQIASACDYLFIMGYDFYGSWSSTTGPSAPLSGGFFNLNKSLSSDYLSVVQNIPNKLILGVPYYGNYWRTKTSNAYTSVDTVKAKRNWVKHIFYNEVVSSYNSKEQLWDFTSNTPWIRWQDSTWNQIWYDSDTSLALKYDLAINKNLKGVGIWALGYDDGREELWKVIEDKFAKPTNIAEKEIPVQARLYQNYPNPFNPETTINYTIPPNVKGETINVTLKVYDVLGREIATLVDEVKQPGIYNSKFLASLDASRSGSIINSSPRSTRVGAGQFSSGVYFYTLRTGSYSETRKMIFSK